MKKVTMTRDMRPFRANDPAVVEDHVADRLVADGDASDARPWPEDNAVPPPAKQYKTKAK
jgi:hypothetical protein